MKKMAGVITPIVTPFTKSDMIDFQALYSLVEYLIAHNINGIYANGSTGEMTRMSIEERKAVAEAVTKQAAHRTGVYIQVGAANTALTVELAKHAYSIGADGIGVLTPQYMGVTDDEMTDYFVEVAKSVPDDFPVYLYNIPQCAANDITPAVVEQILSQCSNVVGIKYSYSDIERFRQYLLCGNGSFDVISGPDRMTLPALAMGCCGIIAGCSQCDPVPFVNCYQSFISGNLDDAREFSRQLNELCDIVKAGSNISYTKASLESEGLPRMYPRKPSKPLSDDERTALLNNLNTYRKKYHRS